MRKINQDDSVLSSQGLDGFARRFGQAIARTGLNQSEFARQLEVSSGFVSDVVRGNKKPGAEFLHKVRVTFGISIDWLLTGDGTITGVNGINFDLLRTIRLQIAMVRSAIVDANPTAKAILLLVQDGRLQEVVADADIRAFIDQIPWVESDNDLALEFYNSQLWTIESDAQQRNVFAAAILHFERIKPIDKTATLANDTQGPKYLQINTGSNNKISGRDFNER